MKPEGFEDIPNHEGRYAAHRNGMIFSYGFIGRYAHDPRHQKPDGHIVKQMMDRKGYFTIMIRRTGEKIKRVFVHHLILATFSGSRPIGYEADHINRIPSDNRIENLRWVTKGQNIRNSVRKSKYSKFKGLGYGINSRNKWFAKCVGLDRKVHTLRGFKTAEEAAIAYDEMAVRLLGSEAVTNKSLGLLK